MKIWCRTCPSKKMKRDDEEHFERKECYIWTLRIRNSSEHLCNFQAACFVSFIALSVNFPFSLTSRNEISTFFQ
jgi:hypothetical protein